MAKKRLRLYRFFVQRNKCMAPVKQQLGGEFLQCRLYLRDERQACLGDTVYGALWGSPLRQHDNGCKSGKANPVVEAKGGEAGLPLAVANEP